MHRCVSRILRVRYLHRWNVELDGSNWPSSAPNKDVSARFYTALSRTRRQRSLYDRVYIYRRGLHRRARALTATALCFAFRSRPRFVGLHPVLTPRKIMTDRRLMVPAHRELRDVHCARTASLIPAKQLEFARYPASAFLLDVAAWDPFSGIFARIFAAFPRFSLYCLLKHPLNSFNFRERINREYSGDRW